MRATWLKWAIPILGFAVFGLLAWQVRMADSAVWRFDRKVAQEAKDHAEKNVDLLDFARQATDAGGVPVMVALAVVGSILLCISGQPRLALFWVLTAALGGAINAGTKEYVHRSRPNETLRDDAVPERNPSYPSGHAMGSIIGYGTLAYVGFVLLRRKLAKLALTLLVIAVVMTIGWTRIYLRAHWCSDVAGGWLVGLSWLLLCIKAGGK